VVDSLRAPIVKGSSSRIQYWTSAIKDLTTINLRRLPVKRQPVRTSCRLLRHSRNCVTSMPSCQNR